MSHLCKSCAKDEVLQSLAHAVDQLRVCLLCERSSDTHIDLEDRRTREVLRSLLRYHFDELEYNSHFGGDRIDELLARPNPIIAHANAERVEALCGEAFESGYENSETRVSLAAFFSVGSWSVAGVARLRALRLYACHLLWEPETRLLVGLGRK